MQRIRALMAESGFDALLLCDPANMYYVTGYYTFETSVHAAVLIPLDGPLAIQVHAIETSNPILKTWIEEIHTYNRTDGPLAIRDQLVRLLGSRELSRADRN